jgi:zinc transport system substrate-binding protein
MKKLTTVLLIAGIVLSGCASQPAKTEQPKPQVAVSIVPQAAFVKAVAGDLVNVVTMIPPGKSPGNYAPTPQEMEKLSKSSLYFAIGVPAETAGILPKSVALNKSLKVIRMNDEVKKVYPEREFSPGQRDPHIWLSPKRARVMVEIIARELAQLDRKNEAVYAKNAREYIAKLDQLNARIEKSLANLRTKAFIVYHPAFGYFADDYGLKMIALEKDGKEATARDLEGVVDEAGKLGIKVVFYQAEIDSRQSKALAEALGGSTEQVAPLAADYIDNLDKAAAAFGRAMK